MGRVRWLGRRWGAAIVVVLVFLAAASSAIEAAGPRRGGTVVFSQGFGLPPHFNPAIVSGMQNHVIGAQLFASPLRYDDEWNPRPYLAESWEVAPDSLSVTLTLVENAVFHDGEPVTSADVAFSIMTIRRHHPFQSMFASVTSIDTPDPRTAVIRLAEPDPAILLSLSPPLCPILPRHVYGDGRDILTHPANMAPVGSGPFRFVRYEPGVEVVLERSDDYFIPGRPYLDRLVFRFESDPDVQMIDLERGATQMTGLFMEPEGIERLAGDEELALTAKGYEALGPLNWLAFNLRRKPLDDRRVRRAIAHAVDPRFVVSVLHRGTSRVATGPIVPDSPFYSPEVNRYEFDPARAESLLDEAGHPRGPDGVRFSLALDYIPVSPSQQRDVARYIKRRLGEIGIEVDVRNSGSFPAWAKRIVSGDFDMTMDGVFNWGDPVIGVHRTYLSSNIRPGVLWSNTQGYRNPEVDRLLDRAARETDFEKRRALYADFQRRVVEDLPVAYINVMPNRTVFRRGLAGTPTTIWGILSPFDELYWAEEPVRERPPLPSFDGEAAGPAARAGRAAIELLQSEEFFAALDRLADPAAGFLDLEGSGLHVVGMTREGRIFFDNSGQLKRGMDISGVTGLEGAGLREAFLIAAGAGGEEERPLAVWPHPGTGVLGPMRGWCGRLDDDSVLCALRWSP